MIPTEHLPLWSKIQQFQLDDETSTTTFSAKLASKQNWSAAYTKRAVAEYRRFLFLCCISPSGAAPSQPVDEVWHLHLTYTKIYWVDLCQGVLGKELHHFPSAGGPAEDSRHRKWYRQTLRQYREIFEEEPPADWWPLPIKAVNIPNVPQFNWNSKLGWGVIALMIVPFLFIGLSYDTFFPFSLGGPHFLVFLMVFSMALFAAYGIVRLQVKRSLEERIKECFPSDASPFQLAAFLYGKHRALQAGIVDAIKRNLLEVTGDNLFRVKSHPFTPESDEVNPLVFALAAVKYDSFHSYEDLAGNWYAREEFTHPVLEGLDQLGKRKEPFWQDNIFAIVFYGLVAIRFIQGIINGRPVVFLLLATAGLSIVFAILWRSFSQRSVIRDKIRSLYEEQLSGLTTDLDRTVPLYALQGSSALSGFAEGALLIGLFSAASPARSSGGGSSWSSDSSSGSDSSCSSGSSCSGGSSCGGCSGN
jgi:uncharacterized protein (TIGR04222 family)